MFKCIHLIYLDEIIYLIYKCIHLIYLHKIIICKISSLVNLFNNIPTHYGLSNLKFDKNNLHTIIRLKIFLSNTNNLNTIIWFQVTIPAHWPSGRVITNELGDWCSISGRVIPKTQKMVLDTSLLSTRHYKAHFKSKVEQSRETSSVLTYTSV